MRLRPLPATALVAALVVPVTLALPVVSAPAAQPHPVRPHVQQWHLNGVDRASLYTASTTSTAAASTAGEVAVLTPELTASDQVQPFRLAGLSWTGEAAPGSTVQVRLHNSSGWGSWEELAISDDTPDPNSVEGRRGRQGTEPILAPGSDGVQVRMDAPGGKAPADVRLQLVDPGSSSADNAPQATQVGSSAQAASSIPPIISRAAWGADESLRNGPPTYMSTVKVGFVHHTASANSYWQKSGWTQADAAKDIRAIYAYDTVGLGWNDIAYNFLVDMAGRIYEGRAGGVDKAVMGAHTGGFNTNSFGVAALGNLDAAAPSAAMVTGIARIMAWKLDLFHRNPNGYESLVSGGYTGTKYPAGTVATIKAISAHRDVVSTACPGRYLYPYMDSIRAQAVAFVGAAVFDPVVSPASGLPGAPTSVTATVPKAQTWTLTVTSLCTQGQARVLTGSVAAGAKLTATWDGRLQDGTAAPPGVYQLLLESAAGTDVARSAVLTYGVTATAGVPATCLPISRLAGPDRYGTSVAIGKVAAPTGTTAVLASGETSHLVDGLVAAPLAKSLGAPLLLSGVDALPAGVSADLAARKVTTVYLVGGLGALGQGVVDGLRALGVPAAGIIRLDGANRYATAARVAAQIGKATDVLLASGDDAHLVDALAAGGPAAATGRPILLTQVGSVPPETAAAISNLGATSVLVVGGEGAVSSASVAGLPGVTRAAGANRYATAAAVATLFAAAVPPTSIVLGSGDPANLVDALAGGSLAQLMLLTQRSQLPTETAAFVKGSAVQNAVILGGVGAVSDAIRTQLDQAAR
jgi:hypothetical protein